MENKKMTEEDVQRYIAMFNQDFQGNIKVNDTSFLINLFENFININMSDPNASYIFTQIEKLDGEITQKLDEEGRTLFKEWTQMQEENLLNTAEQAFIYGMCFCRQIEKSTDMKGFKAWQGYNIIEKEN